VEYFKVKKVGAHSCGTDSLSRYPVIRVANFTGWFNRYLKLFGNLGRQINRPTSLARAMRGKNGTKQRIVKLKIPLSKGVFNLP